MEAFKTWLGFICGMIIAGLAVLGTFYAASIIHDLWH